jgi:hypothetical protein
MEAFQKAARRAAQGRRGRTRLPAILRAGGAQLLAAGFLLASLLPGRAAAPQRFDVFDVFIGYDGIVPEASWFPVVCEIENKGPSFNAIFELSAGNQSQTRRMPLELPTGTHKRFVIPVFSASRYGLGWNARLLDEKGRPRADALVRPARRQNLWQIPLVGALSRTAAGKPVFPEQAKQRNDLQLDVARLQPELFPDNPLALEGLDVLYLNSEQAMEDRLRANQVTALLAWLHGGGHLVVAVEQVSHVNGTEWLRRLLPCEVTGLTTVTEHAALQDWLKSDERIDGRFYSGSPSPQFTTQPAPAQPWQQQPQRRGSNPNVPPSAGVNPFERVLPDAKFDQAPLQVASVNLRGARVVAGTAAQPLIVSGRRGRGQVTVLLFSPERDPVLSWANRPWLWARLANVPPELLKDNPQYRYQPYSIDGVFGAMIDSKQVRKLPVGWLLLLLLGYLAVIGPLDHWWLKKIGRQMLTWITFPAYVAFFSALIYFIGYKLRAGESEWNEIHVVDVLPVGEQADLRGRTFASVYSPANARYPLASELPFAALRGEFLGNYGGGQDATRAHIEQHGNNFVAEISVPVWTSQLYVNDWLNRGPAPLSFTVQSLGERWEVKVDNRLDRRLTDARLVVGGQVLTLGELPARQTKTFTIAKSGESLRSFAQMHGRRFQNAVQQRQQAFGGDRPQIEHLPLSTMAACFASQLQEQHSYAGFITPPGFDLSAQVERGDAVLLVWDSGHTPVSPMHKFNPRRSQRDTLWRVTAVTDNR